MNDAARGMARATAMRFAMVCLACAAVVACEAPVQRSDLHGRRNAGRLYGVGMEHMLRMEFVAADTAFRAAVRADPTYLPALFELRFPDPTARLRVADFIDSVAAHAADAGAAYCASNLGAWYRGVTPQSSRPSPATPTATLCDDYLAYSYPSSRHPQTYAGVERQLAAFPGSLAILREALSELLRRGEWAKLADLAREHTRMSHYPLARATAYAALSTAEHELGRDAAAASVERAVRSDPAWRTPGFRVMWALDMDGHPFMQALNRRRDPAPLAAHVDSVVEATERELGAASSLGDAQARLALRFGRAQAHLDRGRIAEAMREFQGLALLADSLGDPTTRAFVRMRQGRVLVKGGRGTEAEVVLLDARAIADSIVMPMVQKEVEHNLLHLYESLGRHAEARRAGERFVRYASAGRLDPVRMMSARDMGMFLRARGAATESRPYFRRMLADIDSLEYERYYAGEYRELTGDPEAARAYYELALAEATDQLRALEGLVRVSVAMGDTAGARQWATKHDARRDAAGRPESFPLLPGVIARTADRSAARAAFDRARRDVTAHGQVASWAELTADRAALEADAGAYAIARSLADSAAVAATSVGANDVAVRARALARFAAVRAGGPDARAALAALITAADAGDRTAHPQLRAELHRMVAAALAASGRWTAALDRYRRAATPLDSVAATIAMDPQQAAYRSAQRRVYDEALATITAHRADPRAATEFASWSTRRKGRAYAIQLPASDDSPTLRAPRGTALVDYVLLDSSVVALVVSPAGTTIVPLAVRPREVVRDIALLRSALDVRVGSALDVSRARYPLGTAHALYRMLVAPVEPLMAGAGTVTFVPDGVLALVPFDALVTVPPADDERQATFLIDRYTIVTGATLSVRADAWRMPAGRVAVIAPSDAPGSSREVGAISASVPEGRLAVVRGSAATRRATLSLARDAGVLHFAAHAVANGRHPEDSWIGLAPDNGDDGLLRAGDVANLTHSAPLVFLSACETANGLVLDGEGVLSLSRGFLRAGARATVATLWPVGAPAAQFAGAFYAGLARSMNIPTALRRAKLEMRARGATAFDWAPYQLIVAPPLRGDGANRVAAPH